MLNQKELKDLAKKAFPNYKGRKFYFKTEPQSTSFNLTSYWDEGSREYYVMYQNSEFSPVPQNGTPYDKAEYRDSVLPIDTIIFNRTVFQGRECGITVTTLTK